LNKSITDSNLDALEIYRAAIFIFLQITHINYTIKLEENRSS